MGAFLNAQCTVQVLSKENLNNPCGGRCLLKPGADLLTLSTWVTFRPIFHTHTFQTADRSKGPHNKNVLLVKMITSCEQNYSLTPRDWCLDISQITTLHKA